DDRCAARCVPRQQRRLCITYWVVVSFTANIPAVSPQRPGLHVVGEVGIQVAQDSLAVGLFANREGNLHATEEIALHPVGTCEVQLARAVVTEEENSRMLEKTPDDRAHADVLRDARNSRPQCA